jgi:hypothetical protein
MCLTSVCLALFLALIGQENTSSEPGRFVVHATARGAHRVKGHDRWFTMAPQIDRIERLARVEAE